jgi:hypothetical protein
MPLALTLIEDNRKWGKISMFFCWFGHSPLILFACFILNYAIFFFIERRKKEPLKFMFIFLVGMIVPILINLLFWINIKSLSFP